MLNRSCRGSFGAVAAVVLAATALAACLPGGSDCESIEITASAGTFVSGPSGPTLELVARVTHDGKGVEGMPIRFAFGFTQPGKPPYGEVLDEIPTDATGTAVFHRSVEQLSFDRAIDGEFDREYRARWDSTDRIGGKVYCQAVASNTLPLEEFPPPKT